MRWLILTVFLAGCATTPREPVNVDREVPFQLVNQNYITLPVRLNDKTTRTFVLDTGAGISVVSHSLCPELGCAQHGEQKGKRMSGQELSIPLTTMKSVAVGGHEQRDMPLGLFDMDKLMPGTDIVGILSLQYFKTRPFTIDFERHMIVFEDSASLAQIRTEGAVVPIELDPQGEALSIHLPLVLPNAEPAVMEVDTGSQSLILDEHFLDVLGIKKKKVRVVGGKDETGHEYKRYFTKLKGDIHLPRARDMKMDNPEVMFQKIIYDGLIGVYFLRQFRVTFDLQHAEMIFRKFSTAK